MLKISRNEMLEIFNSEGGLSGFLSKSKIPHNCHAYYTNSDPVISNTTIVELNIPPFTTSSSVAIGAKVSSDTIINDADKEIGITDTANETTVVAKPEEIILESSAISNEPEVVEIAHLAAELPSDSNETLSTILPSFGNSSEIIDLAEDATNFDVVSSVNPEDVYSSIHKTNGAMCTVKATDTKSPFSSLVHVVISKISSAYHSFSNTLHSENKSTGDTVSDVNSANNIPFDDNQKYDTSCAGEGALDAGMLSSVL